MIETQWILYLSVLIVGIGLYGIFTRRSMIRILLGTELILNAAMLNLVTFSVNNSPFNVAGQVFVIFIIGTAAAELVIGMVLLMQLYKKVGSIDVSLASHIKGSPDKTPIDSSNNSKS